jgi:hypothetical protein
MTHAGRGQDSGVAPALQAGWAIVAFFGLGLILAWRLTSLGTAVLAVVVIALLAAALVLQAVSDSPWPAYAAIALAVLAAVSRFALEAAVRAGDRRRRTR